MKILRFFLFFLVWCTAANSFSGKSFMTYRSQGFNFARDNSGWLDRCIENNASVAVEYGRAFDSCAITNYFFGAQELIFSGSRRTDRGERDILADYFGLPTDFKSSLRFEPEVKNIVVDFDFYKFLGKCKRFAVRVNAPVVRSTWALNPCETVLDSGVFDYPAGYMSEEFIARADLKNGALNVLSGAQKFGDLVFPLQFGRITSCSQTQTKLADIFVELDCVFVCKPCAELLAGLHVVVPTGTRAQAVNLFETQIGNGRHWALGGSITGRYDFVSNDECGVIFSGHLDVYVRHLFKSTQNRSYDLIANGLGSRYMLLMDMVGGISSSQGFSPVPFTQLLDRQYITRLLYVADATTLVSQIKINVEAEVVAKFSLSYCNWYAEIGYDFWARSAETLVCREPLMHDFYGVKGDAQIYGYLSLGGPLVLPLPLNATQSQATVHAAQPNGNTTNNFINSNADNPALVYNVGQPVVQTNLASVGANTGVTALAQVNGSNQAIIVTNDSINNCSGLSPRALSQKLFGSIRYAWHTCRTNPYVVVGAQGEWAGKVDCVKTAISQWGVWVKGGVNF